MWLKFPTQKVGEKNGIPPLSLTTDKNKQTKKLHIIGKNVEKYTFGNIQTIFVGFPC